MGFNPPSIRQFLRKLPEYGAIFILLLMIENVVISDWDFSSPLAFLFSKTLGPLYPGVHAFSALVVVAATFHVGIVERKATAAALTGLATVATHELVWAAMSLLFYAFNQVAGDNYIVIYGGIMALFAIFGRKHYGTMYAVTFLSVAFYAFGNDFLPVSGTGYNITHGGEAAAIACWVIPSLPWFFVKKHEN